MGVEIMRSTMFREAFLPFAVLLLLIGTAIGEDWDGLAVPATPPEGMEWQIQPISDSFNYQATYNNRPPEFTNRWTDWFINPWSGPSLTQWDRGHVWMNGDELGIQAHHDPNSNDIFMGCLSSLDTYSYPLYMEARVLLSDCALANNIWMLSADSEEEIDMMETYPTSRSSSNWLDQRMHLSHHVFIRQPFQDYQPRDKEGVFGTWYWESNRSDWRGDWVRMGVYWKDPWHLEYYIDGQWVRTIKSFEHSFKNPSGQVESYQTSFNAIDKYDYTNGTGLSKPMHIIVNMEQQSWLTDLGVIPTDEELNDANGRNIFFIDWLRVYKAEEPAILLGDVNGDGLVNLLDVNPLVELITSGDYFEAADINQDGVVNLLDVQPFVDLLSG
ncbi:MAG: dockerin type I domain-containing protein [Planctomycetota bacterium]